MLQQLFDQFVQRRVYLKNVSPSTQDWYRTSWKAAELEEPLTKATLVAAITRMRDRGLSAISVNLRCINAFLRWMHEEGHLAEPLKVPRLKEEKKVMPSRTAPSPTKAKSGLPLTHCAMDLPPPHSS